MKSNKNFLLIALLLLITGIMLAAGFFIFGLVENSSSTESTEDVVTENNEEYEGDLWKDFDFAAHAYKNISEFESESNISSTNTVMQKSKQYFDFTGDGKEEAIVPIESGGTAGVMNVLVLEKARDGEVIVLGSFSEYKMNAFVRDGKLVVTHVDQWVFTPNCCQESFGEEVYGFEDGEFLLEDSYTTKLANSSEGYVDAPKFYNSDSDFVNVCKRVIYLGVGRTDSSKDIKILENDPESSPCPLAYTINNFEFYFNKEAEIMKENSDLEISGKQGFNYVCNVEKKEDSSYKLMCDWYENDEYLGQIIYNYQGQENEIFSFSEIDDIKNFPKTEFFENIQKY